MEIKRFCHENFGAARVLDQYNYRWTLIRLCAR